MIVKLRHDAEPVDGMDGINRGPAVMVMSEERVGIPPHQLPLVFQFLLEFPVQLPLGVLRITFAPGVARFEQDGLEVLTMAL